jgi:hypothetical protein
MADNPSDDSSLLLSRFVEVMRMVEGVWKVSIILPVLIDVAVVLIVEAVAPKAD